MKSSLTHSTNRGVAMLAVLFALLLLSVIGLGMMYSTNMESFINTNYRDKQVALYASMAGLQEARDRLQCRSDRSPTDPDLDEECPATINIDPPVGLPVLTDDNVVYIINPKGSETVAPWDADNKYRDTELCHENILGLTATAVGVPCDEDDLPTGSSWYRVYDNSVAETAGPWHFDNPFDFKWARITLKSNNNTPVVVNGDSSNSNMACWDGTHQIVVDDDSTCTKFGSIVGIDIITEGTGYATAPDVDIDAPDLTGGVQATATANLVLTDPTEVTSITLTDGGVGYTTNPTVEITGGGGSGATATATIVQPGAAIDSVSLSNTPTSCYQSAPNVTVNNDGGGSGATATATLGSNTCIANWVVGGKCSGRKGTTVAGVGLHGTSGDDLFSATLSFAASDGTATVVSIQVPGSGYTSTPTSITNLTGCGALTLGQIDLGKRVTSISGSGGSGYTSDPTVTVGTGTGTMATQPTATAVRGADPANVGQVVSITLTSGGSGYSSNPDVMIVGDGTTTAMATAAIGDLTYKVGSITMNNQGSGYSVRPSVMLTGGGGTGATADLGILGRGASYGKVYVITAMAETATGARTMYQMEAATPVVGYAPTGALTLAGPDPDVDFPNSVNFFVDGADENSCTQTAEENHPAIGGYDDPSDPDADSVETIVTAIEDVNHEENYTGTGGEPDVQNVYGSLGETLGTTQGLEDLMMGIESAKTNSGNTVSYGTEGAPAINYIDGDLDLSGNIDGYGILAVTGTLTISGNFTWHGMVMVVGDGVFEVGGGGGGDVHGSVFVAKIYPSATEHDHDDLLGEFGAPTFDWGGGGGNGISYDHCWATNMMARIPFDQTPTGKPLKILSLRTLPY